ncbi:hypothetical protein [Bacillus methanolicus]|uniref:Uncharacterized protein n=1 Tax=Bacillus methanolicus (strain MGA3 / ATCC 53907) TaxID=796606 RepID=I3EBG0_BACMM|nr:hypothetical protein [Bacillus methanolicus]AIE61512.1 hypothetical protein BMMGA3_15795 [Bacillus methanolicus MGA3]EIJ83831.1 hypothetical protein MGA3_01010 [Bacillus methanolicus MGA3]
MKNYSKQKSKKEERCQLIFIGEEHPEYNAKIAQSPGFFDALQLSRNSAQTSYYILPLDTHTSVTVNFNENRQNKAVQFTFNCHKQKILINEKAGTISEATAYKLLSCFLIKNGKKLMYLTFPPSNRVNAYKEPNPSFLITRV